MRYKHDCKSCVPLGEYNDFDLYYCPGVAEETVVARYSSDGPDYISGLIFGKTGSSPELTEAYMRAIKKSLIKGA